jgi:hypothetical protein
MRGRVALVVFALLAAAPPARAVAPLYDPVMLNIGINCQWQERCERRQRKAMGDAARFIAAKNPPLWKIHLCNRNARRETARVDWVGFNACVRNMRLNPTPRRR